MEHSPDIARALDQIGPRLKRLRTERGFTLAALAQTTGISTSTLSRLESGQRRPSLELLLPIARVYHVPIDDLIHVQPVDDPRIRPAPLRVDGRIVLPLSEHTGPLKTFKIVISADRNEPEPCTHDGHEWLYVLSGRLRLVLADHDLVLDPGEAAEFDTRVPHWFGSTGDGPVEILSLFGDQGERIHVRVQPRRRRQ